MKFNFKLRIIFKTYNLDAHLSAGLTCDKYIYNSLITRMQSNIQKTHKKILNIAHGTKLIHSRKNEGQIIDG